MSGLVSVVLGMGAVLVALLAVVGVLVAVLAGDPMRERRDERKGRRDG